MWEDFDINWEDEYYNWENAIFPAVIFVLSGLLLFKTIELTLNLQKQKTLPLILNETS